MPIGYNLILERYHDCYWASRFSTQITQENLEACARNQDFGTHDWAIWWYLDMPNRCLANDIDRSESDLTIAACDIRQLTIHLDLGMGFGSDQTQFCALQKHLQA